jgi:hypothetical protein
MGGLVLVLVRLVPVRLVAALLGCLLLLLLPRQHLARALRAGRRWPAEPGAGLAAALPASGRARSGALAPGREGLLDVPCVQSAARRARLLGRRGPLAALLSGEPSAECGPKPV